MHRAWLEKIWSQDPPEINVLLDLDNLETFSLDEKYLQANT